MDTGVFRVPRFGPASLVDARMRLTPIVDSHGDSAPVVIRLSTLGHVARPTLAVSAELAATAISELSHIGAGLSKPRAMALARADELDLRRELPRRWSCMRH